MSRNPTPPRDPMRTLYPETDAGGFTRHDGFIEFYTRVNALLDADSVVLDFGAGRGLWATEPLPDYSRRLRAFDERVAKVVGIDVDDAVLTNERLAEAKVVEPGEPIPYDDVTFDLVLADYVLEHIDRDDAPRVAAEILRVLKPGGWFAARTPNKWGMIGIGARAVPNRLHTRALERLQPGRKAEDVFPVRYRMNTRRQLHRLFPEPHRTIVYAHTSEPRYFGNSTAAWRLAATANRFTPPWFESTLMVFVQKHEGRP